MLKRHEAASREREQADNYDLTAPMRIISVRSLDEHPASVDVFISHATEDKGEVAKPLAEELSRLGLRVWYDDFELRVGDSLRRSIDSGLARSRFGIVVLSANFFRKNWPQYELDALVAKEMQQGEKVILPLWHKISKDVVIRYSPALAGKVALNTSQSTIAELAERLNEAMQ